MLLTLNSRIATNFLLSYTIRKISDVRQHGAFFDTAHGKGPCDAIGAEVKRAVCRSILRGTEVVNTAEDVFQAAQNVNVLYVSKEHVTNVSDKL